MCMTYSQDSHPNRSMEIKTLVDLLQVRAAQNPNKKAYIFLEDGENESHSLTYQELDTKAQELARYLQSCYAFGDRALLLYPPGLDFIVAFFACLYAGIIAIPLFPPTRNQKLTRFQAVVKNADAKLSLSTQTVLESVQKHFQSTPDLAALEWLATDQTLENLSDKWIKPEINEHSLCFLQYTSGSTGTPKGVMVSHRNLLSNEQTIQAGFNHDENTVFVGWLPLFHDMGLIGNVIQPLYLGITCVMMPPVVFLQKPLRWLQAISKYRATTSGGPNFAYELCSQKISPEDCLNLDLSCWKVAFNGAEPIKAKTLQRFSEYFASCGFQPEAFYPCYGMAEATLFITGGATDQLPTIQSFEKDAFNQNKVISATHSGKKTTQIVGCGHEWLDHQIRIIDPNTLQPCLDSQVGEIWVSGSSIAEGYWNQPELTQGTFQAYTSDTQEGPYLRTGDLGFLKNGELFITGRLKDMIIIRGRNFYPQDIELSVENAHPALRSSGSAAFSVEIEGEERLIVVQEVERTHLRKLNLDETLEAIRRGISQDHGLQVHGIVLLKPGHILKTSSGKIQRQACKTAYLEKTLDTIATWEAQLSPSSDSQTPSMSLKQSLETRTYDAVQNWLIDWLAQRLGLSHASIHPHKAFADYGMDSVVAVELAQFIENELGKEMNIDATITWNFPTIDALSHYLAQKMENLSTPQSPIIYKTLQIPAQNTEALDTLSEEELAQLLIHEIALVRQRKVR